MFFITRGETSTFAEGSKRVEKFDLNIPVMLMVYWENISACIDRITITTNS